LFKPKRNYASPMKHSPYQGIAGKGTQKKLFFAFGLVTFVFVVLFLIILPSKG
jgi:hypothetical protein